MGALSRFGCLATSSGQTLRSVTVGGLSLDQGISRIFADECLRTLLLLETFYLLRTCQQARLLRIRRVKAHAMGAHRMPRGDIDRLTSLQLPANR